MDALTKNQLEKEVTRNMEELVQIVKKYNLPCVNIYVSQTGNYNAVALDLSKGETLLNVATF